MNRCRAILGLIAAGLALGCLATIRDLAPRLVWNASLSAPVGLYRIHPGAAFATGDLVLIRLPDRVRVLAADRHYLPRGVKLLKRVAARSGDRVCAQGADISVNGRWRATRLRQDRAGRPLPWWRGCHVLHGEVFLLMAEVPDSFDGRYFGLVPVANVIGKAVVLWTE